MKESELYGQTKLSQKKLAKIIDFAPSQLNQIENGETQSASNDILKRLAKAFLGLTTISTPKSREISELSLSECVIKAAR